MAHTQAGTAERERGCGRECAQQSTQGCREDIQPGAGDAWKIVGRAPTPLCPSLRSWRTKWHPMTRPLLTCTPTTVFDAVHRDACIEPDDTAARRRREEQHPRPVSVPPQKKSLWTPSKADSFYFAFSILSVSITCYACFTTQQSLFPAPHRLDLNNGTKVRSERSSFGRFPIFTLLFRFKFYNEHF